MTCLWGKTAELSVSKSIEMIRAEQHGLTGVNEEDYFKTIWSQWKGGRGHFGSFLEKYENTMKKIYKLKKEEGKDRDRLIDNGGEGCHQPWVKRQDLITAILMSVVRLVTVLIYWWWKLMKKIINQVVYIKLLWEHLDAYSGRRVFGSCTTLRGMCNHLVEVPKRVGRCFGVLGGPHSPLEMGLPLDSASLQLCLMGKGESWPQNSITPPL